MHVCTTLIEVARLAVFGAAALHLFVDGVSSAIRAIAKPQTYHFAISPPCEMQPCGCDFPHFLIYALYTATVAYRAVLNSWSSQRK